MKKIFLWLALFACVDTIAYIPQYVTMSAEIVDSGEIVRASGQITEATDSFCYFSEIPAGDGKTLTCRFSIGNTLHFILSGAADERVNTVSKTPPYTASSFFNGILTNIWINWSSSERLFSRVLNKTRYNADWYTHAGSYDLKSGAGVAVSPSANISELSIFYPENETVDIAVYNLTRGLTYSHASDSVYSTGTRRRFFKISGLDNFGQIVISDNRAPVTTNLPIYAAYNTDNIDRLLCSTNGQMLYSSPFSPSGVYNLIGIQFVYSDDVYENYNVQYITNNVVAMGGAGGSHIQNTPDDILNVVWQHLWPRKDMCDEFDSETGEYKWFYDLRITGKDSYNNSAPQDTPCEFRIWLSTHLIPFIEIVDETKKACVVGTFDTTAKFMVVYSSIHNKWTVSIRED